MSNNAATSYTIPITLIGGYLGAGKTTLINKLLSYPGLPPGVAVLVNDFGDVNIDESLIRSESDDGTVIGLSNGCICCSISDDISKALDAAGFVPPAYKAGLAFADVFGFTPREAQTALIDLVENLKAIGPEIFLKKFKSDLIFISEQIDNQFFYNMNPTHA